MNKLESLIHKYCPNGVEYIKIGDVVDYEQPTKYIVKNTDYKDEYDIPVLTAGQSFILGYTNEKEGIYNASKENPVIIFDDFTGAFKWVDFPFKIKSSAMKMLTVNNQRTILRYIFHIMGNINFLSDEHKRLWISVYSNFKIPLPPLPIQEEIVRILDNFTELTAELTAELIAELTARKKQYEYYRDEILSFKNDKQVKRVSLKDIAVEFYRGSGITRDELTEKGFPCVRYGELYTKYGIYFSKCFSYTNLDLIKNPKFIENGAILFAITGESVEDIATSTAYIGNDKCLVGGDIVVMKHNQNAKYLSYALSTTDAKKQKSKGKIKSKVVHSNVKSIEEIKIPLPPLAEQQRIVSILDRFDALCNDITSGLPAEIELRKKQYEYYRDKLLDFKELQ